MNFISAHIFSMRPNQQGQFFSQSPFFALAGSCKNCGFSAVHSMPPSDSHHLLAAQGWIGLGNYLEANEELEKISTPVSRSSQRFGNPLPNLRQHKKLECLCGRGFDGRQARARATHRLNSAIVCPARDEAHPRAFRHSSSGRGQISGQLDDSLQPRMLLLPNRAF
jgi:hypothetical protein